MKNTTAPIWQMVLAGACQAGKEFNAKVVKLGPTSEADITGQIAQLGTRCDRSAEHSQDRYQDVAQAPAIK